jgi:DNA-binding MarR family transcriptional regulator
MTEPVAPGSVARDLLLAAGRLSRRLRRLFVGSGEGLALLELGVLQRVARGHASPSGMAAEESVTTAAIAGCLTRLEGLGLVARAKDEHDGRRVVVTLTEAGRQVLDARDTALLRSLQTVLQRDLSPAELDRLAEALPILEKVARRL